MAWQTYGLDQEAQKLVLAAKRRNQDSLNQAFKMRMAAAYGLERFWGEHLRLQGREQPKADYWKQTWNTLVKTLEPTGIKLPNDQITNVESVETMAKKLWGEIPLDNNGDRLTLDDQRLALAVLMQLCDCLIWWTQRYKSVN
jgi:hypothetical protein